MKCDAKVSALRGGGGGHRSQCLSCSDSGVRVREASKTGAITATISGVSLRLQYAISSVYTLVRVSYQSSSEW